MLLSFTLENWMSFRDPVTFSLIASRERQHGHRISHLTRYKTRVLPISTIYGANASGKTNLFKALNFAKSFILKGTQPDSLIPVEPFRLDTISLDKPSKFSFELLTEEVMYAFQFSVTRNNVVDEKLDIISSSSEKTLYNRKNGSPNFHDSLADDMFLDFAFKGTRDNQLFLTNSVSQKVDTFRSVFDWFRNNLVLIGPDSRFEPFERFIDEKHQLYPAINAMLQRLDTGIECLEGVEFPFDNLPVPDDMKRIIQEEVREDVTVRMRRGDPMNDRFVVTRKSGELNARKLVAVHKKIDGTKIQFEMRQESDGSQRVIDILPAFLSLMSVNSKKVFVIDEIDRSLHTLLTRRLIEVYLSSCSTNSRSQLIFTTHDVLLMDQHLFRRDEMWLTERDANGASSLFSFSDFKDVRYDKDIRKSYLQGRMGGVPRILLGPILPDNIIEETSELPN